MRKTFTKQYPTFSNPDFASAMSGEHWLEQEIFSQQGIVVPNRFGTVMYREHVGREREDFIMFDGDIAFPDDSAHCTQDAWFMYNEPLILNHPRQARGNIYDGDVDFYVQGPVSMDNGSVLQDPSTSRGIRFPWKVATYYPIRNILVIKAFTHNEPNESIVKLIKWILEKVERVGYKYNTKGEALLMGCDPEFTILDMLDERIRADHLFPIGNQHAIGCDGHAQTGELRPEPADCPIKLTENIRQLMTEMVPVLGNDKKVATGGGGDIDPLGHHLHFNKMISSEELELLDLFVGRPSLNIKGADRVSGNYAQLGTGALRAQPHGCEYRTPASSLIPELSNGLHTTGYCVIAKFESLEEGESFDIHVDDETEIPTLESYIALDVSPDGRYRPHLEEYWKWCNRIEGREIDPYKDYLHLWVDGRREVKPEPGVKVNWSNNIFSDVQNKETFLPNSNFEKIHSVSVFVLPTSGEESEQRIMQVCIPDDVKARVNMQDLVRIKEAYGVRKILGFDHSNIRFGLTEAMLTHIGSFDNLKEMVMDLSKVVCI